MAGRIEWDAARDEILRKLDVEALFTRWGVRFTTRGANANGWKECFPVEREAGHPAACCGVGDNSDTRGRYKDMGGNHTSLNLWEFAARFGGYTDWRDARRKLAADVGVKLPEGAEPDSAADKIEFNVAQTGMLYDEWCKARPPITVSAVKMVGGRLAAWPKKAFGDAQQTVVCFPVYGEKGVHADPVNWVMFRADGKDLSIFKGKDKEPDLRRMNTVKGMGPGLLNAAALNNLAHAEVVWKVEGVSDMVALQGMIPEALRTKHIVLTNAFGCAERVETWVINLLANKDVRIIGDADHPGQLGAKKWMEHLRPRAACVRNVILPYPIEPKHGKDLRDYLAEGATYEMLLALSEKAIPAVPVAVPGGVLPGMDGAPTMPAASPSTSAVMPPASGSSIASTATAIAHAAATAVSSASVPPPPIPPTTGGGSPPLPGDDSHLPIETRDHLARSGLHVLGHHPGGAVEVFSASTRQMHRINNVGRVSYPELLLIGGQLVCDNVTDARDPVPGKIPVQWVQNAVGLAAAAVNLEDASPLAQGVWRVDNCPVIVSGGEACVLDVTPATPTLRVIDVPRVGRQLLEFSPSEAWFDFSTLPGLLTAASTPAGRADPLDRMREILANWPWRFGCDVEVVLGLVLATWLQTFWRWRPLVAITGPAGVGKTTLIEDVLAKFFGRLGCVMNKPTEAAIRQRVGSRGTVIIVDEFEAGIHREKVLELFRTTSRGGDIYRGTADQRGRKYGLRHVPWTAAIESGLIREADKSRFIVLELTRIAAARFGRLRLPTASQMEDLGKQILAGCLLTARRAIELYDLLKETHAARVHGRVIECYAVPVAALAAYRGTPYEDARDHLLTILAEKGLAETTLSDEGDLLRAIMESFVDMGGSRGRRSVSGILHSESLYNENREALERHGVALVSCRPGPRSSAIDDHARVFFNASAIKRHLLRGTRWEEMDVEQLLRRLDGAVVSQRRIDSARVRGVELPARPIVCREEALPTVEDMLKDLME